MANVPNYQLDVETLVHLVLTRLTNCITVLIPYSNQEEVRAQGQLGRGQTPNPSPAQMIRAYFSDMNTSIGMAWNDIVDNLGFPVHIELLKDQVDTYILVLDSGAWNQGVAPIPMSQMAAAMVGSVKMGIIYACLVDVLGLLRNLFRLLREWIIFLGGDGGPNPDADLQAKIQALQPNVNYNIVATVSSVVGNVRKIQGFTYQ